MAGLGGKLAVTELGSTMAEPKPRKKSPRELPKWMRNRDVALLVLLVLLNVGSAYTTILGARQILPAGMSDIIGAAVQAMLFLMLAGFAVNRSVIRRWLAIGLFAFASIYTSFFTYYEQLAKEADERMQLDTALQAHAAFVSAVYQPARSRIDKLGGEAEALFEMAEREAKRGTTTGQPGYGPRAKAYADEGSAKKVAAESLAADLKRLEPHFEFEVAGLTPEEVYRKDLEAWQLAPADWKDDVPQPVRTDYVDLEAEVALLTPYNRVTAGEMPALTALGLAALVDGIAIFLGTAIQARRRPPLEAASESVAHVIGQVRHSKQLLSAAWNGDKLPTPPPVLNQVSPDIPRMELGVKGATSAFLTTFYDAIHPVTGVLAYDFLRHNPNESYPVAARMLIDQLRQQDLRWVVYDDRMGWMVPPDAYSEVSDWLTHQIRNEWAHEQGERHPEETSKVVPLHPKKEAGGRQA